MWGSALCQSYTEPSLCQGKENKKIFYESFTRQILCYPSRKANLNSRSPNMLSIHKLAAYNLPTQTDVRREHFFAYSFYYDSPHFICYVVISIFCKFFSSSTCFFCVNCVWKCLWSEYNAMSLAAHKIFIFLHLFPDWILINSYFFFHFNHGVTLEEIANCACFLY